VTEKPLTTIAYDLYTSLESRYWRMIINDSVPHNSPCRYWALLESIVFASYGQNVICSYTIAMAFYCNVNYIRVTGRYDFFPKQLWNFDSNIGIDSFSRATM